MTAEPFDLRRALVADLHAAGEPHWARVVTDDFDDFDAAKWIRLRALPVWPLLSEQVRAAIVAAAETPEGGSVEGWESPRDVAENIFEDPPATIDSIADAIRERDAAHLSALLRILDEPDDRMRALLLAHVGRVRG